MTARSLAYSYERLPHDFFGYVPRFAPDLRQAQQLCKPGANAQPSFFKILSLPARVRFDKSSFET